MTANQVHHQITNKENLITTKPKMVYLFDCLHRLTFRFRNVQRMESVDIECGEQFSSSVKVLGSRVQQSADAHTNRKPCDIPFEYIETRSTAHTTRTIYTIARSAREKNLSYIYSGVGNRVSDSLRFQYWRCVKAIFRRPLLLIL